MYMQSRIIQGWYEYDREARSVEELKTRAANGTNQPIPVENIRDVKIALYAGANDEFTEPEDREWLTSRLAPGVLVEHKVVNQSTHRELITGDISYWKDLLTRLG